MKGRLSTDVTVVGLGRMGSALARACVSAGQRVTVWNRDPARAAAIEGVRTALDLRSALDASPLIIVCLTRYATWSDLIGGIGDGDLAGRTILQLSSGASDEAVRLAARQTRLLARSLDGAIMAFPSAIGTPAAGIMLSGDEVAWVEHGDVIRHLGAIEFLGPRIGDANAWDSAVLVFAYGSLLSAIQGGALLAAAGLPLDGLGDRLSAASRALPGMISAATAAMIKGDYPGDDVALHTLQDLWRQVEAFLERTGGRTDFVGVLAQLSAAAIGAEGRDSDFSAMFEVLRPIRTAST